MFVVKFTTIFFINVAQHTLYDIRDNKPYTVRKLADGNCWMTDNLALELTAGTPVEASLNTSATAYTFTPTSCGVNGTCSMNGNTVYGSTFNTYYYSWYAATAETGTASQTSTDASASICPVGWRMPTNYSITPSKSYGALTNAYGLTTNAINNAQNHITELESSPLNFTRPSHYRNGALYDSSNSRLGDYWASNADSNSGYAYEFYYGAGSTSPQYSAQKFAGIAVRCVAL